jgi:microcystin-dependent protein
MTLALMPSGAEASLFPAQVGAITGQVIDYAGSTIPSGWQQCDGSAISRTTFSALFTAIGTTWGVGDGSTTFNVPDLRGRTAVGAGTGSGLTARTLGQQAIGEEAHALSVAELAVHNHVINISDPGHSHVVTVNIGTSTGPGSGYPQGNDNVGTNNHTTTADGTGITATSNNNGSGTAHNTMQPSAVLNKLIKT